MPQIQGAYSLLVMSPQKADCRQRSQWVSAPCVWAGLAKDTYSASETCALDACGAEFVRDVEPGEIVVVDPQRGEVPSGTTAPEGFPRAFLSISILPGPDSVIDGVSVYEARKEAGPAFGHGSIR